jgi:predicted ribosomally synthesized peptide with nif11-like leader
MSIEKVEKFVAHVKSDAELEAKLKNAVGIPAVVKVANDHGHDIDEKEMHNYVVEHEAGLTDEELDGVVGGLTWGLRDKFP